MQEPPKIISMVKINGEWVNQDLVPPEELKRIVADVVAKAAANIGFTIKQQSA